MPPPLTTAGSTRVCCIAFLVDTCAAGCNAKRATSALTHTTPFSICHSRLTGLPRFPMHFNRLQTLISLRVTTNLSAPNVGRKHGLLDVSLAAAHHGCCSSIRRGLGILRAVAVPRSCTTSPSWNRELWIPSRVKVRITRTIHSPTPCIRL